MTEAVYEWMKNLAIFYIFLTVVMNLVPDSRYGEYIRFFMGLLLILMVLSPLMQVLRIEDTFGELLKEHKMQEEYLESQIQELTSSMESEQIQSEYLWEEYEEEIKVQIGKRLSNMEIPVEKVEVQLSQESSMEVTSITLYMQEYLGAEREQVVRDELGGDYHITEEKIRMVYEKLQ